MAAVTNYEFGGLFPFTLGSQKSKTVSLGQNQSFYRALAPPETREDSVPCHFQLLVAPGMPRFVAASIQSHIASSSLCVSNLSLPPFYNYICDCIWGLPG